ncbi:MAG: hypothetical protein WDW38_000087 [Sanguina aurantia]
MAVYSGLAKDLGDAMEEVPHPSEFTFCWTATTACQHTATALAHSNPPYRGNNPYITDERLTGLPQNALHPPLAVPLAAPLDALLAAPLGAPPVAAPIQLLPTVEHQANGAGEQAAASVANTNPTRVQPLLFHDLFNSHSPPHTHFVS